MGFKHETKSVFHHFQKARVQIFVLLFSGIWFSTGDVNLLELKDHLTLTLMTHLQDQVYIVKFLHSKHYRKNDIKSNSFLSLEKSRKSLSFQGINIIHAAIQQKSIGKDTGESYKRKKKRQKRKIHKRGQIILEMSTKQFC